MNTTAAPIRGAACRVLSSSGKRPLTHRHRTNQLEIKMKLAVRPLSAMTLTLLLGSQSLLAGEAVDGYRSAQFGMNSEEVKEALDASNVAKTNREETEDGDLILDGHLKDDKETGVRFVFPGGRDELALVVEFHPENPSFEAAQAELEERFGDPWPEEMTEEWFERLKQSMPDSARDLAIWGGEAPHRSRFVRLWDLEDYLSIEYLDTELLNGR